MEQSPSREANRFSASQEIPRILWNPKFQYRIHKYPPHIPTLNQLDTVHTTTSRFLKIYLNIIFTSTPGSYNLSLSLRFPPPTSFIGRFSSPWPARLILYCITRTILGEKERSLRSSLFSFLHSPVTSSVLGPIIRLNTIFSNTLSLRSSLNASVLLV
jgi:hypothetical protein